MIIHSSTVHMLNYSFNLTMKLNVVAFILEIKENTARKNLANSYLTVLPMAATSVEEKELAQGVKLHAWGRRPNSDCHQPHSFQLKHCQHAQINYFHCPKFTLSLLAPQDTQRRYSNSYHSLWYKDPQFSSLAVVVSENFTFAAKGT